MKLRALSLLQTTWVWFLASTWQFTIIVILVSGDSVSSSGHCEHQASTRCAYIHVGKTLIHKKITAKGLKVQPSGECLSSMYKAQGSVPSAKKKKRRRRRRGRREKKSQI